MIGHLDSNAGRTLLAKLHVQMNLVSSYAASMTVRIAIWNELPPPDEEESISSRMTILSFPSIDIALQNGSILLLTTSTVPSVAHFTKSTSASSELQISFAKVVFP